MRRMRTEEAVQVSQLIYRTYGMTYFNKDVYYPERIAAHNAHGDVISVVAVGEDGRVAGHCTRARRGRACGPKSGRRPLIRRIAAAGLLDRMKSALEAEARSLGMAGWFADAVAVHTMTQQSNAHHGGHVSRSTWPFRRRAKRFARFLPSRRSASSCVLYFHWLDEPRPRKIFVPAQHQEIVAAIYENLKCPTEFAAAAAESPANGEMTSSLDKGSAVGTIRVGQIGTDSVLAIRHAMRELVERSHAKVVDIELPLEDSGTPAPCKALEADGVAFTGVGPHFSPRGDVLKLAYLVKPLERRADQDIRANCRASGRVRPVGAGPGAGEYLSGLVTLLTSVGRRLNQPFADIGKALARNGRGRTDDGIHEFACIGHRAELLSPECGDAGNVWGRHAGAAPRDKPATAVRGKNVGAGRSNSAARVGKCGHLVAPSFRGDRGDGEETIGIGRRRGADRPRRRAFPATFIAGSRDDQDAAFDNIGPRTNEVSKLVEHSHGVAKLQ